MSKDTTLNDKLAEFDNLEEVAQTLSPAQMARLIQTLQNNSQPRTHAEIWQHLSQEWSVSILKMEKFQDSDSPSYRITTDMGVVNLKCTQDINSQAKFRCAFMGGADHVIPKVKGKEWDQTVVLIIKGMVHVDMGESGDPKGYARDTLSHYLDSKSINQSQPDQEGTAWVTMGPFIKNEMLFVQLADFRKWLFHHNSSAPKLPEVTAMLRDAGCKPTVQKLFHDGKPRDRRCWQVPGPLTPTPRPIRPKPGPEAQQRDLAGNQPAQFVDFAPNVVTTAPGAGTKRAPKSTPGRITEH